MPIPVRKRFLAERWSAQSRMRRRLLSILSVLGGALLILCLISCVRGLTNYPGWDDPDTEFPSVVYRCRWGLLHLQWWSDGQETQDRTPDAWSLHVWEFGVYYSGTYCSRTAIMIHGINYQIFAPLWLPAALPLAYSVGWVFRTDHLHERLLKRKKNNLCVRCGCALTGLTGPNECRCPECGHVESSEGGCEV